MNRPPINGVSYSGDVFTDVFSAISSTASDGAFNAGSVSDWLMGLGYTAASISQALNQVSQTASATTAMRDYAAQERAYLAQQYAAGNQQQNNWLPLVVVVGILVLLSKD